VQVAAHIRDDEGPGIAGAFAHPRDGVATTTSVPRSAPAAAAASAQRVGTREQLQRLEGLARSELAVLQQQAAAAAPARPACPEAAGVAWDLGLDASQVNAG